MYEIDLLSSFEILEYCWIRSEKLSRFQQANFLSEDNF